MTRKVVYNDCYGGFGITNVALIRGREISGDPEWGPDGLPRHDPTLVQVVEEMGDEANGAGSKLAIVEVDGPYRIDEYDGNETVVTHDPGDWVY